MEIFWTVLLTFVSFIVGVIVILSLAASNKKNYEEEFEDWSR